MAEVAWSDEGRWNGGDEADVRLGLISYDAAEGLREFETVDVECQ